MAGVWGETSIMLIRVHSGRSMGVMSFHVLPASLEMWTNPSSLPAQKTPGSWGDSTNAKIVP